MTITINAVVRKLHGDDRRSVVCELVEVLVRVGRVDAEQAAAVVAQVMRREELGSTAIGHGVAIPHAKHDHIRDVVMGLGIHPKGVEFNSVDREPVRLVFLLLSPPTRSVDHLQALDAIVRHAGDGAFRQALLQCPSMDRLTTLAAEWAMREFHDNEIRASKPAPTGCSDSGWLGLPSNDSVEGCRLMASTVAPGSDFSRVTPGKA